MSPKDLAKHKTAAKRLLGAPAFKKLKRGKLPKPLHKMGGARILSTDLLPVSDTHQAVFMWRDGETLQDSAFMAWMFCILENQSLYPLFELHFHPSHKGVHCKLPCNTENDYTNRQLPGAPELELLTVKGLDPRIEAHRQQLILQFCEACGITLATEEDLWTLPLV